MSAIRNVAIASVIGAVAIALVVRSCKSDEQILSEMLDDGREALIAGRRADFLAIFSPDVVYQKKKGRKELERDVDTFIETKVVGVAILQRKIEVNGFSAQIHLRCEFGAQGQSLGESEVDVTVEKGESEWKVTTFSWKQ